MAFTYINQVLLKGIVGDDLVYGRSKNGKDYCTFSLCVNHDYKYLSEEDTNRWEFVRIVFFNNRKKKLVDEAKEMGLKIGAGVFVMGRLQSIRSEYKGIPLIQLSVFVNDIHIIKAKNLKKTRKEKKENSNQQTE